MKATGRVVGQVQGRTTEQSRRTADHGSFQSNSNVGGVIGLESDLDKDLAPSSRATDLTSETSVPLPIVCEGYSFSKAVMYQGFHFEETTRIK